ncbi:GGDEF domain-containing protein [Frateuria terrea]|uniref:diguanylate cyclase n=1 Tax=Frateuria terrea TaxID=529704 RepID=A0A1H6XMK4_9GAMM|nr:GGDEF domain-containing protein [Frateuria terrea]SEJ26132.1 diguanylate cyclase (GGDEF) domain-containing protein [Frateuria terrea]SFP60347.1 diguanylate cyclase (GGDEF) domain-containing protein [Frateuria terrea]
MSVACDIVTQEAPALLARAQPVAAPGPRSVVPSAHARLLDSVAAFTHHRDIDALDHSLALSLAELAPAREVLLCKRTIDGRRMDSLVRCVADASGGFVVGACDPDEHDPALQPVWHCMDGQRSHVEVGEDGCHRLYVPILHEGRALGALQLESGAALDGARALAEGFARIYANYITLLNESERDKLTGLYNRRTFERHLQRMFLPLAVARRAQERRAAGLGTPSVWLAIFDIDHFKRINDTYGHIYGDEVILLLAQQMRACFRQGDVLFRFGGEEFVILLTGHDEAEARGALERFRERVASYLFPQVGYVTVSVGYARAAPGDYPESVIDRADKALYYAKEHGRNRTHGYEEMLGRGELACELMSTGSIDLF